MFIDRVWCAVLLFPSLKLYVLFYDITNKSKYNPGATLNHVLTLTAVTVRPAEVEPMPVVNTLRGHTLAAKLRM